MSVEEIYFDNLILNVDLKYTWCIHIICTLYISLYTPRTLYFQVLAKDFMMIPGALNFTTREAWGGALIEGALPGTLRSGGAIAPPKITPLYVNCFTWQMRVDTLLPSSVLSMQRLQLHSKNHFSRSFLLRLMLPLDHCYNCMPNISITSLFPHSVLT